MAFRKAETAEKSPFMDALIDKEGVVMHELTTYKIVDGKFVKSVHTVRYAMGETHETQNEAPLLMFEEPKQKEELPETKGTKKSKGIPRE